MNRKTLLPVIAVGLALGTAWAVRGKFGHEQGAAWAGAIGALSVLLAARRPDWNRKVFRVLLAAAFGWGLSGMMSYGMIVGYGRATDFVNAFYGLLMLFVLGVLYGFLGGGFFGLALADSKDVRIKWHSLLAEMVAMALLTYALLINQLGWLMTPPRSELWAVCLGAAIALAWFLLRNGHRNVMTVAVWSALGAGFGFAFGNFLQVIGGALEIGFNFWNVMEYAIGFFGGIGMAWGTFTSSWAEAPAGPARRYDITGALLVVAFVPFVVWEQSFVTDRLDFVLEDGGSPSTIFYIKLIAIVSIIAVAAWTANAFFRRNSRWNQGDDTVILSFFVVFTLLYIFLSFLVTGLWVHPPEQYLYLVNLLIIVLLVRRTDVAFAERRGDPRKWLVTAAMCVVVIAVMAIIAMNSHSGMRGSNVRFEISKGAN